MKGEEELVQHLQTSDLKQEHCFIISCRIQLLHKRQSKISSLKKNKIAEGIYVPVQEGTCQELQWQSEAIVLAVYIPPQAPAAGQEFLTISMCSCSQMDFRTYSL